MGARDQIPRSRRRTQRRARIASSRYSDSTTTHILSWSVTSGSRTASQAARFPHPSKQPRSATFGFTTRIPRRPRPTFGVATRGKDRALQDSVWVARPSTSGAVADGCSSIARSPSVSAGGPEPEFVSPAAIWSARTGRLFTFRRLVTFAERSLRPQSRRLQACRPMHF